MIDGRLVAFIATARPAEARRFYAEVVGLAFREESPFALVFSSGGTTLRIQKVEAVAPAPFTALGWEVAALRQRMAELRRAGVAFERFPGLDQDGEGVWTAPGGPEIAWFRDPDGNLLSLSGPSA